MGFSIFEHGVFFPGIDGPVFMGMGFCMCLWLLALLYSSYKLSEMVASKLEG